MTAVGYVHFAYSSRIFLNGTLIIESMTMTPASITRTQFELEILVVVVSSTECIEWHFHVYNFRLIHNLGSTIAETLIINYH